MHALVPTVLLRMPGLDALDVDPEPQPPYGELGQAEQRIGAGEGGAVIGSNRSGEPEVLESRLKAPVAAGKFAGRWPGEANAAAYA
jgi:hypothetical protein